MTAERERAYRLGRLAEQAASFVLLCKGYRCLARRFKTPVGEIDLICHKRNTLVFVEVKARHNLSTARESVTPQMQNRITRAAQYYISRNPALADMTMRFDVIAVAPPFFWSHLDNAWFSNS